MTTTSTKPRLKKRTEPAVSEDPTISCYKVLVPLIVADSWSDPENPTTHQRFFGDYLPEASTWRGKALALYLRTKQIEQVFINQSELRRWRREYKKRCTQDDLEKAAAQDEDEELRELERRRREILAKKGMPFQSEDSPVIPSVPPAKGQDFTPGKAVVEKIDFGGVKSRSGVPHVPEIKGPRRTTNLPNAAEIRQRPTKMLRKKA